MAKLTRHGRERGKERLGLGAAATQRLAAIAWERGQTAAAFAGSFRRYLDGKAMVGPSIVRVHGNHIYLFGGEHRLITVILLRPMFRKLLERQRQRQQQRGIT